MAETDDWHTRTGADVLDRLGVDPEVGLSSAEVAERAATHGSNELKEASATPLWRALLNQYRPVMQLLMLGAAVLSFAIGQRSTGVLLVALTILNAVQSLRQESKAEDSLAALSAMSEPVARVRRDGVLVEVATTSLVPGDIVAVEAGDKIPADGRLIRSASTEIEESALTGESQPAAKSADDVAALDAPVGDRIGMAYMQTLVTRGSAELVVTTTGMDTQIGHIAGMLDRIDTSKSPLQRQLDHLAKIFGAVAGALIIIMLVIGVARDLDRDALFFLAVSVAIGAVPTGMPTITTGLLSLGARKLADHHAIVKTLPAVETLGSTTAICSDKTGTLTLNQMTARVLHYDGDRMSVEGGGYRIDGAILRVGGKPAVDLDPALVPLALCSDAVATDGDLVGDPTEGALVVLAAKGGIDVEATRRAHPRVGELPFDSDYKLMATFHDWVDEDGRPTVRCFVKGAPDVLTARAATAWWEGESKPLVHAGERVLAANDELATDGLRVILVGRRDFAPDIELPTGGAALLAIVDELELVAMVGIVDPPRTEAKKAIAEAAEAGIRVRMITGDHAVTAQTIAGSLGIVGGAIRGAELDQLDEDEFTSQVDDLGVFARVAPEHKVRLVETLQARGEVVAMTGDGVNDAPALKSADIGVAMGITGTDVSKQSATMILTDDDFSTIVRAVRIGRSVYDNLLKYLRFQVASLTAFIVVFLVASVFDIAGGAPVNPLQVLFINWAVTAPPAILLGTDRETPGLMQQQPRPPGQSIMPRDRTLRVVLVGLVMGVGSLIAVLVAPDTAALGVASTAGTMGVVALSLAHIAAALTCRFERQTLLQYEAWDNARFLRALVFVGMGIVALTEVGFLQRWFLTVPLTAGQWAVCLAVALGVIVVDEARKLVERRRA